MKSYPLDDFIDLIDQSTSILQIAHINPDGDTLGSNLALRKFLLSNDIKTTVACFHKPSPQYSYLTDIDCIQNTINPSDYDLIITVDVADLKTMTGFYPQFTEFFENTPIINIDHHHTNSRFGRLALIDPKAASVGEIMFYILNSLGADFDQDYATYLMTALYFDTGSFQHSNTTSTVMDVSANLMLHEVQHNEIAYQLFQKKLLPMLKLWGIALNKLNVDEANGISWVFISQDDFKQSGAEAKDIEGLINLMHGIPKIKMTVILSERENGMVKGSIRTQEGVDASYYAAVFGGGGHNKAAGFNANLLKASLPTHTTAIVAA